MSDKNSLPSSILISLYLALAIVSLFLLADYLSNSGFTFNPLTFLTLFILSFVILVFSLEWYVFRKLKDLNLINQLEIRKLKEMENYRREFLGEVSHELKTPIFAVQGFVSTLLDGAMDDKKVREKFLKKALRNADRLSNLVNDLLVITRVESGEMEMKMEPFNIHELIIEIVESMDHKLTRKSRNISLEVLPNKLESTLVIADRERIQQVFINLIDNAIKYGDTKGEVKVELQKEENKILVNVHDDGPGIEPEHISKIFRRFYRVDKSRSRDKGGTGLGLAICKHIVEAHKEAIKVYSEVGKGTTFSVSLRPVWAATETIEQPTF